MIHTMRKYLNNRGSALFMVLTTMIALMITCMAMYFTVVSARSAEFAVFNQQQSYQSAISISDMTVGGILNGSLGDLITEMFALDPNDSNKNTLSTKGNNFSSLSASGTADDDLYLGAYSMDITRLPDENGAAVFDIATTTSAGGVQETVHTFFSITKGGKDSNDDGGVFTATGFEPVDNILDKGYFYFSQVRLDNEVSYINAYGGNSNLDVAGDIVCGGSLVIGQKGKFLNNTVRNQSAYNKPSNFIVRNNLTILQSEKMDLKDDIFYVGGNCEIANWMTGCTYYINGDLHVTKSTYLGGCDFYVNGNVYYEAPLQSYPSVMYCNNSIFDNGAISKGNAWSGKMGKAQMSPEDVREYIKKKTPDITYPKWTLDESEVPSVKCNTASEIQKNHHEIMFDGTNVVKIPYSVGQNGCLIRDILYRNNPQNINNGAMIIIDTGDKEDNVFTMRVLNNTVASDGTEYFTWSPKDASNFGDARKAQDNHYGVTILKTGKGSLVIDVPEGVIYQDESGNTVCDIQWWTRSGYNTNAGGAFQTYYLKTGLVSEVVHTICNGCCSYKVEDTGLVCDTCKGNKKVAHCNNSLGHDSQIFCPKCDKDKMKLDDAGMPHDICADRLNNSKFGSDAPNNNIYLISTSEGADFRFSKHINPSPWDSYWDQAQNKNVPGRALDKNSFVGTIFAPYMTFKAEGPDGTADAVRFIGRMIVSDFRFQSTKNFVSCWPKKTMPDKVIIPDDPYDRTSAKASKSYKIDLGSY